MLSWRSARLPSGLKLRQKPGGSLLTWSELKGRLRESPVRQRGKGLRRRSLEGGSEKRRRKSGGKCWARWLRWRRRTSD
jgi:hypothetical protein